ncbi:MAG: hypothetical protein APR54_04085 [Candidatus Cloacimonas sp. SDB]|nr:MAG: hypothetical protein APR54_04085 [Candidatus Cloacimonas sp. SDB]
MKKLTIGLVIILLLGSLALWAEEETEDIDFIIQDAMDELDYEIDDAENDKILIKQKYSSFNSDSPKMGVFLSDLDFEDIYEMHYDYNYGVYISGVTKNGPSDKAGLMEGDIIMEFDGVKVRYEDHLVRMIKSHKIGDEVKIKFFRDENIYETSLTLDTLEKKDDEISLPSGETKRKIYLGHGGGGWLPVWFMPDVTSLNSVLSDLEFKDETFSEDGFLLHGGAGKGNVGKGWFIGGMGAGYNNKETSKHDWEHYANGELITSTVSRKAEYDVSYAGFTLDRRLGISNGIITSLGFLIGWGQNLIKISQSDSNSPIPNFDFDDPSNNMDDYYDYKSKLRLKKDYIVFQPKAMLMVRILDWLAIRSEAGYVLSHSTDGWKAKWNGEKVKLDNAPDSNLDGLTLSIGPWFGF